MHQKYRLNYKKMINIIELSFDPEIYYDLQINRVLHNANKDSRQESFIAIAERIRWVMPHPTIPRIFQKYL